MKKVYIVILNYNGFADTEKCLKTLHILADKGYKLTTFLVDNGSKREEIKKLKSFITSPQNRKTFKLKNIRLIENKKNLGFAGGMNNGIREALKDKSCEYVLILNNDTILPSNLLTVLDDTGVDIISPVIKFKWNGKWIYDYGGKINWWTGRTTHLESSKIIDKIDYISGCCMLVKREVFEKIGLFDESYFFYFEDVDFCVRARKAGFTIAVNPNINIEHKLGGSIGRWSNKAIYYNLTANAIFIRKNLGLRWPLGYLYLTLLAVKIIINKLVH